ncbi:MAG TPA: class I SAM-dependent methyltransferase [Pyrinomonadaceae bacterium]|jgi:SAM-dependent methyltransferase|nr:class I SAM-dependent methyltransferase [Pyrinomonadaceae bacterium]
MTPATNLHDWFGGIDIYLFDLLLRGHITPEMKLLDAGCGGGRNLTYFFRTGFDVSGVDQSVAAITEIRSLAAGLSPNLPRENFRLEAVEKMSFGDSTFDVVLSSAVLHFARNESHWREMVREMWRVLKPGGIFFARLASTVGIDEIRLVEGRRYHLPDGSQRFLVDEEMLLRETESLGGRWLEPFKTVVVHHQRAMSNWILIKD